MIATLKLKRFALLALIGVCCFLATIFFSTSEEGIEAPSLAWIVNPISAESHLIRCYDENVPSTLDEAAVVKNEAIFFLETYCHNRSFHMNPRQACAVESAANLNPESTVYVLVPSPFAQVSAESHMSALLSYPNVKIEHINMNTYFQQTPLENWYKRGLLKTSRWPMSHASDILRYTTLWKFGGYYVDLDIVMLKSFKDMMNFAGAESDEDVAAGFLALSHGHPLAELTMLDLKERYQGWKWGTNGPGVITRTLKQFCQTTEIRNMTKERCKGFSVYPPSVFYPIHWKNWKDFFVYRAKDVERVMAAVNGSVAIHVWNNLSVNYSAIVGSNQPYVTLAKKFCPKVYSTQRRLF